MKILLKVFNPLIWIANFFMYSAHVDLYRTSTKYVPYDFNRDIKYF